MQEQSGRWPATTTWGERHAKLLYKSSWTPRPACLRACPAEPAATYNLCLGFRTRHRISDRSGSSVEPTQHTSGKSATDDATAAPASQGVLQAGWKRCITCVQQQQQFPFCHLAGFLLHSFFLSFFLFSRLGNGLLTQLLEQTKRNNSSMQLVPFLFLFLLKNIQSWTSPPPPPPPPSSAFRLRVFGMMVIWFCFGCALFLSLVCFWLRPCERRKEATVPPACLHLWFSVFFSGWYILSLHRLRLSESVRRCRC